MRLYEERMEEFRNRTSILAYLETTAADGLIPSRTALARIYGKGIGVTHNLPRGQRIDKRDYRKMKRRLYLGIHPLLSNTLIRVDHDMAGRFFYTRTLIRRLPSVCSQSLSPVSSVARSRYLHGDGMGMVQHLARPPAPA